MSHHKLLVIGLDGAPYPLIQKWTQAGYLPNLARLTNQGCFGILRSTLPVHSPTAWASFITGMNAGKHGVFDFVELGLGAGTNSGHGRNANDDDQREHHGVFNSRSCVIVPKKLFHHRNHLISQYGAF